MIRHGTLALCLLAAANASACATPRSRHHRSMTGSGAGLARLDGLGDGARPTGGAEDLYRSRGYGIGGAAVVPRGAGLALSGACAEVANANPACNAGGYGPYGNGLEYGFGAR